MQHISISFVPLPICDIFRINSLFALSVYPFSRVSQLHLFRSPFAMQSLVCSFAVLHSLAVHRTEAAAVVVCCTACIHPPTHPISIYFVHPPALRSPPYQFFARYLCLSTLQCLSSPSIPFARSPCNLLRFRFYPTSMHCCVPNPPGIATTWQSVDIRFATHRNALTVRACICCLCIAPT